MVKEHFCNWYGFSNAGNFETRRLGEPDRRLVLRSSSRRFFKYVSLVHLAFLALLTIYYIPCKSIYTYELTVVVSRFILKTSIINCMFTLTMDRLKLYVTCIDFCYLDFVNFDFSVYIRTYVYINAMYKLLKYQYLYFVVFSTNVICLDSILFFNWSTFWYDKVC